MKKYFVPVLIGLLFSCNTTNNINKKLSASCETGFYWLEGNEEKVNIDSVAITGYIKIVDTELNAPPPFSAIYFNDKRVETDKLGKIYIKLHKGDYTIRGVSGGAHSLSTKTISLNGGGGVTIIFYFKAKLLVD
jgi:hypothetical protein